MKSGEKVSGTCQACFGTFATKLILGSAEGEKMVLHGYKRPGLGYVLGKCWGVGKKPYELDVEVTKAWRNEVVENVIPGLHTSMDSIRAATELTKMVNDYKRGYDNARRGTYHQKALVFVKGQPVPENERTYGVTFESLQKSKIGAVERDIAQLERLVKELDRRIKNWVYAPEKLVKEERKGPLVHESRCGNQSWAALCRTSYSVRGGNLHTTQDPAKVTCPKCIERRK